MASKRDQLISDAKAAGYTVREHRMGTQIRKIGRHGRITAGITLWADGYATRDDVDLTIATKLRTFADMRRALGL